MKYACGIVRDLMPLYVEKMCSEESVKMVRAHLEECETCRQCYSAMNNAENNDRDAREDAQLADGLKMLRKRIGKRTKAAIAGSAAVVLVIIALFEALFNLPLKTLWPEDLQVSAQVYAVGDLPSKIYAGTDDASVSITRGGDDDGEIYSIEIPDLPNASISISQNLKETTEYLTVINWNSRYALRKMRWEERDDGATLYITSVKTTILNNKANEQLQQSTQLEMRRIDKIVYVDSSGKETTLWQK